MPVVNFPQIPDIRDFSPVPEGTYLCRVSQVEETTTPRHDIMWRVSFTIIKGRYQGHRFFDNLIFSRKVLGRVNLLVVGTTGVVGGVVRVNRRSGQQSLVTSGGYLKTQPTGIAIERDGSILVVQQSMSSFDGGDVIRVNPITGQQSRLSSNGLFGVPYGITVVGNLPVPAIQATWGQLKARYR